MLRRGGSKTRVKEPPMVCIQTRDDRPSETDTGKLPSRASAATHGGAAIHWLHRVALRVSTDLQAASFYSTSQAYRAFSKAEDRKSTRLNSSHLGISYAVF